MTYAPSPEHEPEIPFTPVPCRRHDGWTATRQRAFIRQLSRIGLVAPAAAAVGMSRTSAYGLRKREGAKGFAAAWDMALEMGQDNAEQRAVDRALDGYEVLYFYGGLLVASLTQALKRDGKPTPGGK